MATIVRLTVLMIGLLIAGELAGVVMKLSGGPWSEPVYRGYHLLQMVLAIATSLLIRREIAAATDIRGVRKVLVLIPLGLGFSLIGDIVNSRLIDLTHILPTQTLLSIPFFTTAHVFYVASFYLLCRSRDLGVWLPGRRMAVGLVLWPFLGVGLWLVLIPGNAESVIRYLSLFYAMVVTLMAVGSFWVLQAYGRPAIYISLGGILFALSDSIIGYCLLRPGGFYFSMIIWLTYFSAQLLILYTPLVVIRSGRLKHRAFKSA